MPGYSFLGETSSDEIVGHLLAYPLLHDLVAETAEEKARILRLLVALTLGIVENDWYLIGETGQPTQWGKWNPNWVNDYQPWYDGRGINSVQILSWLQSAYSLTEDQVYLKGFTQLEQVYSYGVNIINFKITQPSDDNFSDDELSLLALFTWAWSTGGDSTKLPAYLKTGLSRTYGIVRPEKPALWTFIYAAAGGVEPDWEGAAWCLQTLPLSWVDWPVDNSARLDIQNIGQDRSGAVDTTTILPYDEISFLRWNGDPFDLNGGTGLSEYDPTAYLLPYWMGRYFKFIQ